MNIYVLIYIIVAIVGACIGSFLNVVIARLPEKGSFLSGRRSRCLSCGKTIKPYDLIPIFSWLILRGRCRNCKAHITVRYMLVEEAGAFLALVCLWRFGLDYPALLFFGVSMILITIALIDYDTSEIPDSLIVALVPFAFGSLWLFHDVTLLSHGIGAFTVALPMLLLSLFVKGAFGGGDIKLMAICGFMLGWQHTLIAFFIALILGGGTAIYLLASGKRKRGQYMVFGPALCAGVFVAMFLGPIIFDFYMRIFNF